MSGVLAIIPARVGSKSIPNKNFRELNGVAPWQRAFRCCQAIPEIYPVVTSDLGRVDSHWHYAPAPLHTDTCSMVDVVLDVLRTYPGTPNQKILLVQPTQPLRKPKHLIEALAFLDTYDSIASVVEVEPAAKLYYGGFQKVAEGQERRQDTRRTYMCDGTVYGFRRGWFERYKLFRCLATKMMVISPEETARLDTPFDWEMAELRLRNRAQSRSSPVYADNEDVRLAGQRILEIRRNVLQALAEDRLAADSSEGPSDHES